jgi:FKBP-type peptidyl-prolyl cis-trans isomerase
MALSRYFILLLFVPLLLASCGNQPDQERQQPVITRDTIIKYNREAARSEDEEIGDFIRRYGWEMTKTPTGLRYMIYHHGNGPKAIKGKTAVLKYTLKLLNGTLVYSSDKDGVKEFRIGYGGVESGLEEGILLLNVGDKVKFIVPSHLAFGLLGDQNKIPPGASLVYDIELLKLK